ncbi:MAG: glyceraldehyde-3-phosphate dehydrogenase [Saprospiraceae bacterium]|nr:glyceraldehyde-3-phosphate dehydrogenase [Saprospiraceae bacterium]
MIDNPAAWLNKKRSATALNYYIGELMYQKGIELVLFRNSLNEVSISELLSLHEYAKEIVDLPIEIETSVEIAKALLDLELGMSKVDIGKLNSEWSNRSHDFENLNDFLKAELNDLQLERNSVKEPVDVILYGFGRIGRLCARAIIDMTGIGAQLRLRAIVTRSNDAAQIVKRADLLRMDSVHGPFKGVIQTDGDEKKMIINGEEVHMIAAKDPGAIDYTAYGIKNALVIDNTGVWRDKKSLSQHINSKGVQKVLLTAPGKEIPNIVYGVNHLVATPASNDVWSAASCTTNAIVPILKVIDDKYGLEKGHIETIHAYTNDQNLLDNMHKKHRRGRSAAINMVITETGAAKAVSKVMPHLDGKLTGSAVRVPTPNGSLAIMNLELNKTTSIEEVNLFMKNAALSGPLRNQIKYSFEKELVSNDIIGNTCCSVFDSPATKISRDGKNVVLYVWYDNEFGYTQQVIRLAKYVMDAQRKIYD